MRYNSKNIFIAREKLENHFPNKKPLPQVPKLEIDSSHDSLYDLKNKSYFRDTLKINLGTLPLSAREKKPFEGDIFLKSPIGQSLILNNNTERVGISLKLKGQRVNRTNSSRREIVSSVPIIDFRLTKTKSIDKTGRNGDIGANQMKNNYEIKRQISSKLLARREYNFPSLPNTPRRLVSHEQVDSPMLKVVKTPSSRAKSPNGDTLFKSSKQEKDEGPSIVLEDLNEVLSYSELDTNRNVGSAIEHIRRAGLNSKKKPVETYIDFSKHARRRIAKDIDNVKLSKASMCNIQDEIMKLSPKNNQRRFDRMIGFDDKSRTASASFFKPFNFSEICSHPFLPIQERFNSKLSSPQTRKKVSLYKSKYVQGGSDLKTQRDFFRIFQNCEKLHSTITKIDKNFTARENKIKGEFEAINRKLDKFSSQNNLLEGYMMSNDL